jgi:aconitate decarboxylase
MLRSSLMSKSFSPDGGQSPCHVGCKNAWHVICQQLSMTAPVTSRRSAPGEGGNRMQSHTRRLAEFAADLRLSDVPAEVIARAKSVILDGLGCGLFGATVKWAQILTKVVGDLEPAGGSASIWGGGRTASPTSAALINGTMVQGYELDDANPASIHSCAVVLPAAIAVSELLGTAKVSGEQLLTAAIAGFEVGPRVGHCMNGNRMLTKGWHSPGIFGPFPAATAAGRILGLDSDAMVHALGIAGPQAAGLMSSQFGSMVKRMLSAKAAQSGVYSALLAANGFTGVIDIFEESYGGYCTTFTQTPDQFDLPALTDGLGERWETMRISIKRHSTVGTNLSALDAVEDMMSEGLKAEDVESIMVRMTEDAVRHSYWTPYLPTGMTAAHMHIGYCMAVLLLRGEVFIDTMVEEDIGRPDLMEFAAKVVAIRDEEREKKGRPFARGAEVTVKLRSGGTISRTVDNFLGSFQRPMSDEQMAAKYRKLASKSLSGEKVAALEKTVRNLEHEPDVRNLVRILKDM